MEYLGFLVKKWVPKKLSVRKAFYRLLPILFGLREETDRAIVLRMVTELQLKRSHFQRLLTRPRARELLRAGNLPEMVLHFLFSHMFWIVCFHGLIFWLRTHFTECTSSQALGAKDRAAPHEIGL